MDALFINNVKNWPVNKGLCSSIATPTYIDKFYLNYWNLKIIYKHEEVFSGPSVGYPTTADYQTPNPGLCLDL